ncbi:RNA polymerase sigma factor [Fodinicola feengrottensis]|uniref:RNA polymerase sigma factor n=1 Tax=Fodinicola feengrottensis TaxID=435914 RepID=UPI002442E5B5|nr:sigma-70 family RNA polymerase sigma factor [Fodinicola feengrottensis]
MPVEVATDREGGSPDPRDFVERLYIDSASQLLVAAFALTGNVAEAQDAVHEAFLGAFAHPSRIVRADNPVAYLRTVTLNIARERFRRRQRLRVLMRRIPVPDDQLPGLSPDRTALLAAIRQLPANQREAITLFYLADMSVEDVAANLKAPTGMVKAWLSRGRAHLATLLGDDETPRTRVPEAKHA